MEPHRYPRRSDVDTMQLHDRIRAVVGFNAELVSISAMEILVGTRELSPDQKAKLDEAVEKYVYDPSYGERREVWSRFPVSARIVDVDVANKRLTVTKNVGGQDYERVVGVSGEFLALFLLGQHLGSQLVQVGDTVLVDIVDDDPSKMVAMSKVLI